MSEFFTGRDLDVVLVMPTLNAGHFWHRWLEALKSQTVKPPVLVIDSSSTDHTALLAAQADFRLHAVRRDEFDHGATRQLGMELLPEADLLIYMTQDAVLADPGSLSRLLAAFNDPQVGVAYGRQLPHPGASPIAAHARLLNYPPTSEVRSAADIPTKRLKTVFSSDSFAAYRRSALEAVGGFPSPVIWGEDAYVAAKLILSGWKVAYVAEATVYHSHDYTLLQEMRRYFDAGVFHARNGWLLDSFGGAEGEGLRFLRSEVGYLWRHALAHIPSALIRTGLKYMGYRLGRLEARLPLSLKIRLTSNPTFFRPPLP